VRCILAQYILSGRFSVLSGFGDRPHGTVTDIHWITRLLRLKLPLSANFGNARLACSTLLIAMSTVLSTLFEVDHVPRAIVA
jgi:hypothetical protein